MTTAAGAAGVARAMIAAAEPMPQIWRHVILQTIDEYESQRRLHLNDPYNPNDRDDRDRDDRAGGADRVDGAHRPDGAAAMFADEPPLTGDDRVDAALAALAEHLARRDGWPVPDWTGQERRSTLDWWFVDDLTALQAFALRESPLSFRKRGVFIGDGGLHRV